MPFLLYRARIRFRVCIIPDELNVMIHARQCHNHPGRIGEGCSLQLHAVVSPRFVPTYLRFANVTVIFEEI